MKPLDEIRRTFKKKETLDELKSINLDMENTDLYSIMNLIKSDILNVDKTLKRLTKDDKKTTMLIDAFTEDLEEKSKELYMTKLDLDRKNSDEIKMFKNIIEILDQVDSIFKYATQVNDENLLRSINNVNKNISKYTRAIGLEEIICNNQLFDPNLHKCIAVIENNNYQTEEIIDVIQKGYIVKGNVLRYSSVSIAK